MDHASLGSFVKGGSNNLVSLYRVVAFASLQRVLIIARQRLEARFDAVILQLFARAIAHAAFGRLRIRHKLMTPKLRRKT